MSSSQNRASSSRKSAPRVNKDTIAKWAKETINKTIPDLLIGDAAARKGIEETILIRELPALPVPRPDQPAILFQVWQTDTLTAAQVIHQKNASDRVAILNMASCVRPGGGVLWGATTQEEFLCTRTTVYPALRDEYYRLPEVSVIYTRDSLVFRDASGHDLPKSQRYHVDVLSAAMLRSPDLIEKDDGSQTWAEESNKEVVLAKMRLLMRAAVKNGIKRVVLGAWGCGAYGNPVAEVAKLWRIVLVGGNKGMKEAWEGIEEVVFAITNYKQVEVFRTVLSDVVSDSRAPI